MDNSVDLLSNVDASGIADETENMECEPCYVEEENEGTNNVFKCKVCESSFDTKGGVNRHHTVKHKSKLIQNGSGKKRKLNDNDTNQGVDGNDDEEGEAGNEGLSDSFLNEWDDDNTMITSTQKDNMAEIIENFGEDTPAAENTESGDALETVGESFFNTTNDSTISGDMEPEQPTIVNVEVLVAQGKIALLESKVSSQEQNIAELNQEYDILKKINVDTVEEKNSLKEDLNTKTDMINILEGKVSSLELHNETKENKLKKYTKMMMKMNDEVKKLRKQVTEKENKGKPSAVVAKTIDDLTKEVGELRSKNKKLSEVVKIKNKALKESEDGKKVLAKNLADARDKLEYARNSSNKNEAEKIRVDKMNERVEELISSDKNKEHNKRKDSSHAPNDVLTRLKRRVRTEKCKFFESGRCKYGEEDCFKIHPKTECNSFKNLGQCDKGEDCLELHGKTDCPFWMRGSCMFKDESCRFLHDQNKFGIDKNTNRDRKRTLSQGTISPRRSEGILKSPGRSSSVSGESSEQVFPKGLVEEVTEMVVNKLASNQPAQMKMNLNHQRYSYQDMRSLPQQQQDQMWGQMQNFNQNQQEPLWGPGTGTHRRRNSVTFSENQPERRGPSQFW